MRGRSFHLDRRRQCDARSRGEFVARLHEGGLRQLPPYRHRAHESSKRGSSGRALLGRSPHRCLEAKDRQCGVDPVHSTLCRDVGLSSPPKHHKLASREDSPGGERIDPEKRIIPGPIGLLRHSGGASEYKTSTSNPIPRTATSRVPVGRTRITERHLVTFCHQTGIVASSRLIHLVWQPV